MNSKFTVFYFFPEIVSGSIDHKTPEETISPMIESTSIRGPYFDNTASKNVTALVGHTAYLNCRVRNLGNRTVRNYYYSNYIS